MAATTTSGTAVVTLPSPTQILIRRDFNAPKRLVYRAITEPELVKRWWNAKRGEVTIANIDLRVGGNWRYVILTDDGTEVAFHGTYREIVPNERVVTTEIYEMPGLSDDDAAVNTISLSEKDGRTTMTVLVDHKSQAHRDAVIESGMEAGMQDAYDLLEELAVSLR
jgi:uncharacterized protein YndB with AHSA1/START domain